MTLSRSEFRDALLDPTCAAPDGLCDSAGRAAGKRFDVYRNNVTVSLIEAVITGFPLVTCLLGNENMQGLVRMFVRAHPPSSPLMMLYGDAFPGFLAETPQLSHLGYLPDAARLDLALRQSYHAADAAALDPSALAEMPPEDLMASRVTFAPAMQLMRSDWPLYDIWRFNMQTDAPKPVPGAQDVIVLRPGFDPEPHLLPAGAATWIAALRRGDDIATALEVTQAEIADFDLAATLSLLIAGHALISLTKKD